MDYYWNTMKFSKPFVRVIIVDYVIKIRRDVVSFENVWAISRHNKCLFSFR